MAYEWENDVWAAEVASMSEMDRAIATEDPHAHLGVYGDPHAHLGVYGDRNDDR